MAQSYRPRDALLRYWPVFGGPVLSSILLAGVSITALAAALRTGVWAGILGILGILLILLAVVSRVLIGLYQKR